MKIAVIGTGYVGLVAGTCFADSGNDVICVDINEEKIRSLQQCKVPIYEPGLTELIHRNMDEERLSFTTDLVQAVERSSIIFIAVGTPAAEDGSSDLAYVLEAARQIGKAMTGSRIVVNKSTVPVGSTELVRNVIEKVTDHPVEVLSNPEFMKEGAAVQDFLKPDRVIIGSNSVEATETMQELYSPFTRTGAPFLVMDPGSAELTKYAANAMLASRISFMNEIANLCEQFGADVYWIRRGIGTDRRIGPHFLFPGIGYGGSCFPKDIKALIHLGKQNGMDLELVQAIEKVNEKQKLVLFNKVKNYFSALEGAKSPVLKDLVFAVWGLAFKPQTDDMREAPSRNIIEALLAEGARIQAYDPEAMTEARKIFGDRIQYAGNSYEALEGADALLLVTEWNSFRNPDFEKIRTLLKRPLIFDGRNQYEPGEMREVGLEYFGIGRP